MFSVRDSEEIDKLIDDDDQYLGYGTCVSKSPNLYLHSSLYLLNLSSGLNLAG